MRLDAKIIIAAILLCIVIAGIVLFTPVQPNRIEAIAESASAIITAASIIILVRHNREAAKQNTEAIIRTEWYYLNTESQRLKKDADLIERKHAHETFSESRDRYIAIMNQMRELYDKHQAILSNWPAPPQTFKHLIEKESHGPNKR